MHRNAIAVRDAARTLGIDIDVREFPEGTRTAADAAAAIGTSIGQIVKSLIFAVGDPRDTSTGEVVLALVSGDNQLAEAKLAQAAGAIDAWRVDANAVREATGFPVGGVPPFGHATKLRAFIDEDLLAFDEIWAAAGTPQHVFRLVPEQLLTCTDGARADLAQR